MRLLLSALALSAIHAAPAVAMRSQSPADDPARLCRPAILAAEREHKLPNALLHAIGRVETGRVDPRTGAVVSWPWTINAEGQGRFFETKEAAVAAVQTLRARGVTVVDVGCLQVNLHFHPRAFASLEEAFDPAANARYAALFLSRLHGSAGNWERAAAHYHSHTPERAEAYRLKVLAAWPGMAHRLAAERERDAAERRRDALAAAWGGDRGPAAAGTGDGFHSVALGLSRREGRGAADRGLLDPAPAQRQQQSAARRAGKPPRPPLQEVAEAPRRR